MDNTLESRLFAGAEGLGLALTTHQVDLLLRYQALLLDWNRKINLTSVTDPAQAIEVHLLDSIAALPICGVATTALDLGAGGGFPGVPLAILEPERRWTLVDAVAKKVGFLKAAAAQLGLRNVTSLHARLEGRPEREGVPRAELVISRAFMAPEPWLRLAVHYVTPGGIVAAMLGAETEAPSELPVDLRPDASLSYLLPESGASRRILTWRRGQ